MYQKTKAELEMKKVLSPDVAVRPGIFVCETMKYDVRRERIYLLLKEEDVTGISLDAVYECRIENGNEIIVSEGRVKERYWNENGKILEFQIENGFYKNSIKSVDKQEV